jgi:hypothetical protein
VLLPHMAARKLWLKHALRGYPLYDPPHKVEERLLSDELAADNFAYFMHVRLHRMACFQDWLRRYFLVTLTPDAKGVRALSRWGNKYAGLLLNAGPTGRPTDSYFTYEPSWIGDDAGCNVVFDMGITLGEFLIVNCPKLHWDLESTSATLPRTAKMLKGSPGMSFQRPALTGSDNPTWKWGPLHYVFTFASQMSRELTSFEGLQRFHRRTKMSRRRFREQLSNNFESTRSYYPTFGIDQFRQEMSPADYVKFIDMESEQEDEGRE